MCIAGFDMKKKKLLACSVLCGLIIGCGLAVIFKDKTEKTPVSEVTEKKIKQEPVKEEIKSYSACTSTETCSKRNCQES